LNAALSTEFDIERVDTKRRMLITTPGGKNIHFEPSERSFVRANPIHQHLQHGFVQQHFNPFKLRHLVHETCLDFSNAGKARR
jgi:hypothetical protein